jgi:hypothetical protein
MSRPDTASAQSRQMVSKCLLRRTAAGAPRPSRRTHTGRRRRSPPGSGRN